MEDVLTKTKIGALLENAINKINKNKEEKEIDSRMVVANYGGDEETGTLPILIKLPTCKPTKGESWQQYKERVMNHLGPISSKISEVMGCKVTSLITANALQTDANVEQIEQLTSESGIDMVELDPLVQLANMDDAIDDIGLPAFRNNNTNRFGKGVKVAVLDSGVDTQHPHLSVSKSVSTCGESVDIPGSHGTHCAGSIASNDSFFAGIAPEVELFNIKALRADGSGRHTFITRGIDEALDLEAHIISMSIGFNHLPTWSSNGHGWLCKKGHCPLCVAVDNASSLDNTLMIVAAGNEHLSAETLRQWGYGNSFDTELGCPGQAREAFTVGAITKNTHLIADFSSRGPSSYGLNKPDICAPGVNITSTIPVPRDSLGKPILSSPRSLLFGRKSGTSMATPIMVGVAALVIQEYINNGKSWTPLNIKNDILKNHTRSMGFACECGR